MIKILLNQYFWLVLVILIGFWARLYKIDAPIADWHSWRQADTAAVTRNFVKMGFNPILPRYDDMSGVSETPLVNTLRFRFVEFPLYNMAVYPFYITFGVSEVYHRLVSVLFSLGSIVFVYLIAKRYLGVMTALLAAAVFALLPFNVFFQRTTLPEPTFVFFALGMMYFLDRWIGERRVIWGIGGFIFMALSFLIKPWAIFFYLPLVYSVLKNPKILKKFLILSLLAIIPFILWRLWILQQPEGIPASNWLLNGDGIRFRPAFFRWIIAERLGREILGATGLVLLILGLIFRTKNNNYFLHIWLLSLFLYFIVFATGNVRHDYYQIIFVPIASIFLAKGFVDLFQAGINFIPRIWTIILALILLPLSFYFSWYQVRGFYQINNPAIVEAGQAADRLLPQNAVVVAPYNGDTAFLYQTNRPGWAVAALPLKEMVADYGVTHYVSTAKDDKTNWVIRHFEIVEDKPNYLIADLTKLRVPFDVSDPEP